MSKNMDLFIICYDLINEDEKERIRQSRLIKKYIEENSETFQKVCNTTWVILIDKKAEEITEELSKIKAIDSDDRLFVSSISGMDDSVEVNPIDTDSQMGQKNKNSNIKEVQDKVKALESLAKRFEKE